MLVFSLKLLLTSLQQIKTQVVYKALTRHETLKRLIVVFFPPFLAFFEGSLSFKTTCF